MVKTASDIKRIVAEYVDKLSRDIKVDKAILFGSYARGNPRDESDIDLAIISEDLAKMDFVRRQEFLGRKTIGCDTLLEPIGYTREQYEHAEAHPFLNEIKRTGKVVWAGRRSSTRCVDSSTTIVRHR
ncbi:MAG: nucleotidyltransferase domain-containing protein [Actinobacteria bacterium]|nr:nucleotidyltransferase domain-containing protein [Actinomycetota bacterium]